MSVKIISQEDLNFFFCFFVLKELTVSIGCAISLPVCVCVCVLTGKEEEVGVIERDGLVYNGRVNTMAVRKTETKLPAISAKDGKFIWCTEMLLL